MVSLGASEELGGKGRVHGCHLRRSDPQPSSDCIGRCIGRARVTLAAGQRRGRNGVTFRLVLAAGLARAVSDGHGELSGEADHFPMSSLVGTSRCDQCGSGAFR
jgi:hypothetical protein